MKINVYIDAHNIYKFVQIEYNTRIKYRLLMKFISDLGTINRSIVYITQSESEKFSNNLKKLGIIVNDTVRNKYRSCIVQLTIDALHYMDECDTIVICSNNPMLKELILYLLAQNKKVILFTCLCSMQVKHTNFTVIEIPESLLEKNYD